MNQDLLEVILVLCVAITRVTFHATALQHFI